MASLRDIKKRIRSVKNTSKITKAMKMVAAAKLRRAQEAVTAARPYAQHLDTTISLLAKRAELAGDEPHPLLAEHAQKRRAELVVLTGDRGLCGAFNTNVIRRASRFFFDKTDEFEELRVSTIGKKGMEALRSEGREIRTHYDGIFEDPRFTRVAEIAEEMCASYVQDDLDEVWLLYTEFHSPISQTVKLKRLLPVVPKELPEDASPVDYIYEPSRDELLGDLLPRHFATELYQSVLESLASEHGSRMTAMDNASRNAAEMVDKLELQYNRLRQAAITTELMEIISGAESLK